MPFSYSGCVCLYARGRHSTVLSSSATRCYESMWGFCQRKENSSAVDSAVSLKRFIHIPFCAICLHFRLHYYLSVFALGRTSIMKSGIKRKLTSINLFVFCCWLHKFTTCMQTHRCTMHKKFWLQMKLRNTICPACGQWYRCTCF